VGKSDDLRVYKCFCLKLIYYFEVVKTKDLKRLKPPLKIYLKMKLDDLIRYIEQGIYKNVALYSTTRDDARNDFEVVRQELVKRGYVHRDMDLREGLPDYLSNYEKRSEFEDYVRGNHQSNPLVLFVGYPGIAKSQEELEDRIRDANAIRDTIERIERMVKIVVVTHVGDAEAYTLNQTYGSPLLNIFHFCNLDPSAEAMERIGKSSQEIEYLNRRATGIYDLLRDVIKHNEHYSLNIVGENGSGKTHLANSVKTALNESGIQADVVSLRAHEISDLFKYGDIGVKVLFVDEADGITANTANELQAKYQIAVYITHKTLDFMRANRIKTLDYKNLSR